MTTTQHHAGHLDLSSRGNWANKPHPSTPEQWVQRAREVAQILAVDAAAREKEGKTPYAEVALLKESGLVTLLGPVEHGGAGQEWPTAYHVIREVAAGDGSIGQLLGYHYLWNWAARLVGTPSRSRTSRRRRRATGGSLAGRSIPVTPTW